MAERARKIITGRKRKEINAAINTINYILYLSINKQLPFSVERDLTEQIAERHIHALTIENSSTPAQLLKSQIPSFDINKDTQFRNAKWEEYFAILALAALGDIHHFHHMDGEISGASVGLAAESMEALSIAENPSSFTPELNRPIKEQIRIRNQRSAIEGHAVLNEWKQKFADWVKNEHLPKPVAQGKRLNNREAARQFEKLVVNRLPEKISELQEAKHLVRIFADSLTGNPRVPKV